MIISLMGEIFSFTILLTKSGRFLNQIHVGSRIIILSISGSMQTMPLEYPKEYVDC